MDQDTLRLVCEPFFTTKGRGQGTGLGLSTVYGIVKQHGGHLQIESTEGKGSSFTIYLPAIAEGELDAAPETPQSAPDGPTLESILVVEDNEAVGRMTRTMLVRAGYRVALATSAPAALELAGGSTSPFNLLLTDIVLPGVSGPELHQRMVAHQARPEGALHVGLRGRDARRSEGSGRRGPLPPEAVLAAGARAEGAGSAR